MKHGQHRSSREMRRSGTVGLLAGIGLVTMTAGLWPAVGTTAATPTTSSSVTKSVVAARVHLVNGVDVPADSHQVSVTVDVTSGLRDREPVNVTWSGAHPSAGLVNDRNSSLAAQQEYPVVLMQCRGVDSTSVPVAQQISPKTCWTQTPSERYISQNDDFPAFRLDRYADAADRSSRAGVPNPLPAECLGLSSGTERWVPFVSADGTSYAGGPNGCGGLAPEAVLIEGQLQPGNTTYGASDIDGKGAAKFIINTSDSNASLGCSATVPCSLVAIPIVGVSCDAAGAGLPVVNQPPAKFRSIYQQSCAATGNFTPDNKNPLVPDTSEVAVSGRLWWSQSNWQNRITIPLEFAPPSNVCDIVSSQVPTYFYGSQALRQATQQWAPAFCTDPKLFKFQHVQTSEPQAKNLLDSGLISAAFAAGPPAQPFSKPIVQAPIAISGFAIVFAVDGKDGTPLTTLRLSPRLLAKLLTQSYASNPTISGENPAVKGNPLDIGRDPEFKALNPDQLTDAYNSEPAATLFSVSSDSDVITALTSYLNADPEARAWLDGTPDPWGMKVNTNYRKIALPVQGWPQLDSFVSPYFSRSIPCLNDNPIPWLPLVAAPVSDPAFVTLNMQYGIANSQINCKNAGAADQKLASVGRQNPGQRLLLGLVALGDAARYQLDAVQLQTHSDGTGSGKFTDSSGRSFAGPTDDALRATVALLRPNVALGTWPIPYKTMRASAAGKAAYPGTMLMSADVPTSGLAKADGLKYAEFLKFAVSSGQIQGPGNGKLPPGYLPLTAANGAAALIDYTQTAAAAVSAQMGVVPAVDGSTAAPATTPSPSASPQPTATTGTGTGSSGGGTPTGGTPTSSDPAATPSPSASPTKASTPTTVDLIATGITSAILPGPLGKALPALVLLALVTGLGAAATGLWGRR